MSGAFGPAYADAYDALYADKDYDAECDLIEEIAAADGRGSDSVLDLGSGTGRHAVALAARDRRVVGLDVSPDMVAIARRRGLDAGTTSAEFHVGDIRTFRSGERFDVALLMFAVLGYQLDDAGVDAALATAVIHLEPRGVVIFDVWNGPAVEAIGPTSRTKTVSLGGGELRRTAQGTLEPEAHICTVDYRLEWILDGSVIKTELERHRMRYFFADELEAAARRNGLEIVRSGAFPDFDRPAGQDEWNALYVARAAVP